MIHAVTITKDRVLIAGIRRIEAFKKLRIEDIPVHVLDIPIKENGEIDENLVRKDFTVEEKVAIKRYRESIEPSFQGQRSDLLELRGKFPQSDINQRRERIAKFTGAQLQNIIKTTGSSKSLHNKTLSSSAICRRR